MRRLDGVGDSVGMDLSRLWGMLKDREAWRAIHGVAEQPNRTWRLNNSNKTQLLAVCLGYLFKK